MRSRDEILSTLDADGTLAGLPFMPEMLDWCGKSFRVERRAEKTCVAVAPPVHPNRRFAGDDVVVLEGPRCPGDAHDGCKRSCKIFWKEAWLRPFDPVEGVEAAPAPGRRATPGSELHSRLKTRLKTKSDESHYFCQSTELLKATEAFPGNKRLWRMRIMVQELRNGDRSAPELIRLSLLWGSQAAHRKLRREKWVGASPRERTPLVSRGLRPGDAVRIRAREEIEATLDQRRSNRGLTICYEMFRLCAGTAEVDQRVERIILEGSGEMREIRDTVTLKNVRASGAKSVQSELGCLCANEIGDCPRGEVMFWRESWLERVDGGGTERRDTLPEPALLESALPEPLMLEP